MNRLKESRSLFELVIIFISTTARRWRKTRGRGVERAVHPVDVSKLYCVEQFNGVTKTTILNCTRKQICVQSPR